MTLKLSTVYVAERGETKVFRSVEEVPPGMRRRLAQRRKTGAMATILIANRGGQEELRRRLKGLPSRVQPRVSLPTGAPQGAEPGEERAKAKFAAPEQKLTPPRFQELSRPDDWKTSARWAGLVGLGLAATAVLVLNWL